MVLRLLISAVLLSACSKVKVEPQDSLIYPGGPRLLLAGSGGGVGRLDLLPLSGGVTKPLAILPIHTDATVRSFAQYGKTFVINRFGMDSIYVMNKGLGKVVNQVALKKGSNPQDVLMLDEKTVLITQRSEGDMLEWNLETGSLTSHPLGGFAFEKGIPDMMSLTQVNGKVWISLQRLKDRMKPIGLSQVVEWDRGAKRFSAFDLAKKNPVTAFKRDNAGGLYLGCAANMGVFTELDGGIEKLDPNGRSEKVIITEAELGGDVIDFEILDAGRGVALVSKPQTALIVFDVARGKRTQTLVETADYELVRINWDRANQRLYVSDRNRKQPKLRVFDTNTLKEVATIPLALPVWEMEIEQP